MGKNAAEAYTALLPQTDPEIYIARLPVSASGGKSRKTFLMRSSQAMIRSSPAGCFNDLLIARRGVIQQFSVFRKP